MARSRAATVRAAKRAASSDRRPRGSGIAMITAAASTPMMASTIMSSISVKPLSGLQEPALLPVADIGILALAAFLVVGAIGKHVERAVLAGLHIAVRMVPGIIGQALDVSAL